MKLLTSSKKLTESDPNCIRFWMCRIGSRLRPGSFLMFGFEPRFKNLTFAQAEFEKA